MGLLDNDNTVPFEEKIDEVFGNIDPSYAELVIQRQLLIKNRKHVLL